MRIVAKVACGLLAVAMVAGCSQQVLYTKKKFLMGTEVEVISPYPEAAKIVFDEIERVEKVFSPYVASSCISHLNDTGFLNTNFEVASLIEQAKAYSELTGGMFDISILPVATLWKKSFKTREIPKPQEIEEALQYVGSDKIYIDHESKNIKLKQRGMGIDVGALAKGYAIDAAVKELKRNGIDAAVVRAGGDMFCLGTKHTQPWKVGLQHPRKKGKIVTTLTLQNQAVATSGDYQQFIDVGSNRYHHIINPKTGYPVQSGVVSVSVIAKDAMTADVVATCVFLLGKEQGLKVFKNHPGVEQIIVLTKVDMEKP